MRHHLLLRLIAVFLIVPAAGHAMEVKKLLEQGEIGAVKEVKITMLKKTDCAANDPSNWRIDPVIAGGGYFYDLAPHQIDLIFYFFGKAKSFSGISSNKAGMYKAEDFVQGTIELENGIICKGLWDFSIDGEEKEFKIRGYSKNDNYSLFNRGNGYDSITVESGGLKLLFIDRNNVVKGMR